MLLVLLAIFLGLVYTDLVGYFSHKLLHSGKIDFLYRLHMEHHITQYPPRDLRSDTYRTTPQKKIFGAGPEWALPIGSIMLVTAVIMAFLVPWWFMLAFFGSALGYALVAYSWLHDQFHLKDPSDFLTLSYSWFTQSRHLHDVHHHNMRKNYGIGSYWLDKLFGTYKE